MRIDSQPAYVVHTRPYRDSSAIVELFTRDYGLVALLAKGVRSAKSKRPSLQPFNQLTVGWVGKGELPVMTGVEQHAFLHCSGDRLTTLIYLNELLLRLLKRYDPYPELFMAYEQMLSKLAEGGNASCQLRLFETSFLEALGYGLLLEIEADGVTPIEADQYYRYLPEFGAVADGSDDAGVEVVGAELLALNSQDCTVVGSSMNLKRLLRVSVERYLERSQIKSRELFRVL